MKGKFTRKSPVCGAYPGGDGETPLPRAEKAVSICYKLGGAKLNVLRRERTYDPSLITCKACQRIVRNHASLPPALAMARALEKTLN